MILISSKPAARRCCARMMGHTDGETHRRTDGRYIEPGAHTVRAVGQQVRVTCSAAGHTGACEERITSRDGGVTGQHRERRRLTRSVHSQQTETLACRQYARLHTALCPELPGEPVRER